MAKDNEQKNGKLPRLTDGAVIEHIQKALDEKRIKTSDTVNSNIMKQGLNVNDITSLIMFGKRYPKKDTFSHDSKRILYAMVHTNRDHQTYFAVFDLITNGIVRIEKIERE